MRKSAIMGVMGLVLGGCCSSCGLLKMPFRIAGSVASHGYQAGKRVVKRAATPKDSAKPEPKAKADVADKAEKPEAISGGPPGQNPPPPAAAPSDPNVPVPPVDLPEMPGDILPPPPEDLPPL